MSESKGLVEPSMPSVIMSDDTPLMTTAGVLRDLTAKNAQLESELAEALADKTILTKMAQGYVDRLIVAEEALTSVDKIALGDGIRHTVHAGNAFEHWQKLNRAMIEIRKVSAVSGDDSEKAKSAGLPS